MIAKKYLSAHQIDWKYKTAEKLLDLRGGEVINRKLGAGTELRKTKVYGCCLEGGLYGDGCETYGTLIYSGVRLGNKVRMGELSEIFLPITIGECCKLENTILQASGETYLANIRWMGNYYRVDKDIPVEVKRIDEKINSKVISKGRRWKIDGVSEGYISNKMNL